MTYDVAIHDGPALTAPRTVEGLDRMTWMPWIHCTSQRDVAVLAGGRYMRERGSAPGERTTITALVRSLADGQHVIMTYEMTFVHESWTL